MMALNYKVIIFIVLINAYMIKPQTHLRADSVHPDFKNGYPNQAYTTRMPFFSSRPPTVTVYPAQLSTQNSIRVFPVIPPSTTFRFTDVGLQKIGPDFISSDDAITLSLDNNEINDISPFAFLKMKNMRHLVLSGNKIPTEKFLSLYGNIKLQTLIIDNNKDNSMRILKEYEILQNLEHLHLCSDQLLDIQVPFHVATPSLISLHLSNNSINSDNVLFDNLPATLTHLHLDRNSIDHVEQNKLRGLHELMMDHNLISHVCLEDCQEKSISLKGAFEMRRLHLSNNSIAEISPDAFTDMKHLSYLNLSDNKINDMPQGIFNNTNKIINLSLANNVLVAVPNLCPMLYLKQVDLSGNRISGIFPDTFCPLRHLENINLSNNVITNIHSRAFMQLSELKHLDLSQNRLRQLPARWMSPWSIQELHLEHNKFTKLDDISLTEIKSLQNIYLEGNPMTVFEAAYFHPLSNHLLVHIKNVQITDKVLCNCENDEEEDDEDNGNGDNDTFFR